MHTRYADVNRFLLAEVSAPSGAGGRSRSLGASAYAEMNEALALPVLSGQHPELHLLDWWGYTQNAAHWLTSHGVHFTRAGAYGMADFISRTLAAFDERPCPAPWEFSAAPVDPCPPPVEELGRRGSVPQVMSMYDALR